MIRFVRSDHFSTWDVAIGPTQSVQIGDLLAKITTGPETGLYGSFSLAANDGRQTLANAIGPSTMRVSGGDTTGFQERILPNQDGRLCTYVSHCANSDANEGYYYDANGARHSINAEAGLATKAHLAGMGFGFIN